MQRFYGGPPDAWLYVPLPLLGSYAESMGAVRASERLSGISDGRVGSVPVKAAAARRHVSALQRAADAHRPRRPADPRRLRAAGIRVERVTRGE